MYISLFIILNIIIVFSYNKVALGRIVPKTETYELSEDISQELESENEEQTEVVTTYILDAAELKHYEKSKEYNKGKRHPFAEDNTNASGNNANGNEPSGGNFYEDEGK